MSESTKVKWIIKWNDKSMQMSPRRTFAKLLNHIKKEAEDIPELYELSYENKRGHKKIISNQEEYTEVRSKYKSKPLKLMINAVQLEQDENQLQNLDEDLQAEINATPLKFLVRGDSISLNDEENKFDDNEEKEEMSPCMACHGKAMKNNGTPCKKCVGTGKMNKEMYNFIKNKIENERKKNEDIKSSLESSIYQGKEPKCSNCDSTLKSGDPIYVCKICIGIMLCETCENNDDHLHAKLKLWVNQRLKEYSATVKTYDEDFVFVVPGETIFKIWTITNNGRKDFPKGTIMVSNNKDLEHIKIDNLPRGGHFDVCVKLVAPNELGPCRYDYEIKSNAEVIYGPISINLKVVKEKLVTEEELTPERALRYAEIGRAHV